MKNALKLVGLTGLFLITIGASVSFFIILIDLRLEKSSNTESTIVENTDNIEHSAAPDFFNQSPEEGLVEALEYYEIQFPEIVYAQALLETGHFSSSVCKDYNNLFGLYNSKIRDYYSFEHWSDSVKAYRDFVQYKYKGNTDYYTFLINLPYATDPNYIRKIKQLEHKYWAHSN
jgi:hypothetical protein